MAPNLDFLSYGFDDGGLCLTGFVLVSRFLSDEVVAGPLFIPPTPRFVEFKAAENGL
jgi:hypothetical protein